MSAFRNWNETKKVFNTRPENISITNLNKESYGRLSIEVDETQFESCLLTEKDINKHSLFIFLSAVGLPNEYPIFYRKTWSSYINGICFYVDDPTRKELNFHPAYYYSNKSNYSPQKIYKKLTLPTV